MGKKLIIGILILCGLGVIIFIGYIAMLFSALGAFDRDYSVSDLKANFEANKVEIYELKKYYKEIVPKNRLVEIEFEDDNTLGRFRIEFLDTVATGSMGHTFLEWDLKINNARMDSILSQLGWTGLTLKTLKEKLYRANCIQIESGEPTKIGFKRSGLGMYSFNVFDKPIPDSLRETYNDSCTYILADDKLVLEYGGGAAGPQCFYNKN
jgi:hypothetical protein